MSIAAHFWTVAPALAARLVPPSEPASGPFRLELPDPLLGVLTLTGRLHAPPGARALVVALHGLAGSQQSSYLTALARAAVSRGFACLRLNLRGADLSTPDFYHAGLTADLASVLAAPALAGFEQIVLVGYSLGGHVALRWAAEQGGAATRGSAPSSASARRSISIAARRPSTQRERASIAPISCVA